MLDRSSIVICCHFCKVICHLKSLSQPWRINIFTDVCCWHKSVSLFIATFKYHWPLLLSVSIDALLQSRTLSHRTCFMSRAFRTAVQLRWFCVYLKKTTMKQNSLSQQCLEALMCLKNKYNNKLNCWHHSKCCYLKYTCIFSS